MVDIKNEKPESEGRTRKTPKRFGWFTTIAIGSLVAVYAIIGIVIHHKVNTGEFAVFWTGLGGSGRSNVIAAGITLLGLVTSALIVPFVFKDRISTFNDMVDRTDQDLKKLNTDTRTKLEKLTQDFSEEFEKVRAQTQERADESKELMESVYAALTSSLGQGQITDERHAKQLVSELWEKLRFATRDRLSNKKYLRAATKEEISGLKDMSTGYLDALVVKSIITEEERNHILELRRLHYAHSAPTRGDFQTIVNLQDFVSEFNQSES